MSIDTLSLLRNMYSHSLLFPSTLLVPEVFGLDWMQAYIMLLAVSWCFPYRLFDKNKFVNINCNLSLLTNLMLLPQRPHSILKLTAFMDEQDYAKHKNITFDAILWWQYFKTMMQVMKSTIWNKMAIWIHMNMNNVKIYRFCTLICICILFICI